MMCTSTLSTAARRWTFQTIDPPLKGSRQRLGRLAPRTIWVIC